MKTLIVAGAALGCFLALPTNALAQRERDFVRPWERYCLESRGVDGLNPLRCSFSTLGQCMANKLAPIDRCMLNPRIRRRG